MDAKVDNWVVTPRRGKAVEINGLGTTPSACSRNGLRAEKKDAAADTYAAARNAGQTSFNNRFWFAEGNYLYDVVDGESGE